MATGTAAATPHAHPAAATSQPPLLLRILVWLPHAFRTHLPTPWLLRFTSLPLLHAALSTHASCLLPRTLLHCRFTLCGWLPRLAADTFAVLLPHPLRRTTRWCGFAFTAPVLRVHFAPPRAAVACPRFAFNTGSMPKHLPIVGATLPLDGTFTGSVPRLHGCAPFYSVPGLLDCRFYPGRTCPATRHRKDELYGR